MRDDAPDVMMDDLIDRVVEELRRPVPPSPAFDARMTEQLRAASHRRRRRVTSAWAWLRQSRTVHLSPLGALGIAAAAVVMVIFTRTMTTALGAPSHVAANAPAAVPAGPIVSAAEHDGVEMVRFVFVAPNARSVALAGDFNNWSVGHTMMRRVSPSGLWTVDVPLHPGRYTYTFVVDGTRWVPDPSAPREIGDDFGAPSSVLAVMDRGRT